MLLKKGCLQQRTLLFFKVGFRRLPALRMEKILVCTGSHWANSIG